MCTSAVSGGGAQALLCVDRSHTERHETKFVSSRVRLGEAKKKCSHALISMGYGLTYLSIMKKILFPVQTLGIQNVFNQNVPQAVPFRLAGGASAEKEGSCAILFSLPGRK